MPGPSGHDVLQKLRANPLTEAVPVVMLTGSGSEKDAVESYGRGANRYLQKPVKRDVLMDVVEIAELYWSETTPPG